MTLERRWPAVYRQLLQVGQIAERHLRDVADIDFTVDNGRLFVVQIRKARKSPLAHIRVQLQLLTEGLTSPAELLKRVSPADVAAFLYPRALNKDRLRLLGTGLATRTATVSGRVHLWRTGAQPDFSLRQKSLLVVNGLLPEHGLLLDKFVGVLANSGGVSSHAALICGQLGKPCVAGFKRGAILPEKGLWRIAGHPPLREGDWLTIDGMTGEVYAGRAKIATRPWKSHPELLQLSVIIEKAVSFGHVPPVCAGPVWRIWDFMRHGLPLPGRQRRNPPVKNRLRPSALLEERLPPRQDAT